MTLKEQVAVRLEIDISEAFGAIPSGCFDDTARHILDLVKAHLENGGTLDD